jgi:hypothetical protein
MGLDIALGIMVLLGAIRGWLRGFVLQGIRLGGLVGCVYAADPIRDYARPYILPYLSNIPVNLLDRMLWWVSALVAYMAMVGLSTLAVKLYRKRPYGEPEPNRPDQFAGMLLAAAKTAIYAAFLVASLEKYGLVWIKQTSWANDLAKESVALTWQERYRPSEKIWAAAPVQHFITHVVQQGIKAPSSEPGPAPEATVPPVQTADSRPPRLDLPTAESLDPKSADFTRKFDEELQKLDHP